MNIGGWLLAAGEGSADWEGLLQYGVLGLVVLAFITGKIVPGYIYERRVSEHHEQQSENRLLEGTLKDRVIPELVKSTEVMVKVVEMLDELEPRRKKGGL